MAARVVGPEKQQQQQIKSASPSTKLAMTNLLDFPAWAVLDTEYIEDCLFIVAKRADAPAACPLCGVINPSLEIFALSSLIILANPCYNLSTDTVNIFRERTRI
jgi:hypothetical protein